MCEYIDDHTTESVLMYVLIVEKALCYQTFFKYISESARRTTLAMVETHRDKSWPDHLVKYLSPQKRTKCRIHHDSQNLTMFNILRVSHSVVLRTSTKDF